MKDFSQYKLNVKKSPKDERDLRYKTFMPPITLPEEVDYRDIFNRYFPVFDQGNQGSCASCAGTAMRQIQEYNDIGFIKKLSEQFVYNNREDLSEEGMYMRDLMDILLKMGVCINDLCPYGNLNKPSAKAYQDALKHVIEGYASVGSVLELKTALYQKGPCVIAVPVYNYGTRMWKQQSGDEFLGGHSMACVGYNKDGFIIRNSWGEEWGDNGYCIMPYTDFSSIWEVWSTVDAKSIKTTTIAPVTTEAPLKTTTLPPEPKKSNYIWWIISGVIITGLVLFFILK
jgi:hypothetical protein